MQIFCLQVIPFRKAVPASGADDIPKGIRAEHVLHWPVIIVEHAQYIAVNDAQTAAVCGDFFFHRLIRRVACLTVITCGGKKIPGAGYLHAHGQKQRNDSKDTTDNILARFLPDRFSAGRVFCIWFFIFTGGDSLFLLHVFAGRGSLSMSQSSCQNPDDGCHHQRCCNSCHKTHTVQQKCGAEKIPHQERQTGKQCRAQTPFSASCEIQKKNKGPGSSGKQKNPESGTLEVLSGVCHPFRQRKTVSGKFSCGRHAIYGEYLFIRKLPGTEHVIVCGGKSRVFQFCFM